MNKFMTPIAHAIRALGAAPRGLQIAGLLGLLALGGWAVAQSSGAEPSAQTLPAVSLAQANASSAANPAGVNLPAARTPRLPVGCMISPKRIADIGSSVVGIVSSVKVDVGDEVDKGQVLVKLSADVESASVQAAQARSDIDADVRAAEAGLELARQRFTRAQDLQAQGFVSPQAAEQASAEFKLAREKLAQARGQKNVSSAETGVSRAQLGQRTIKSPFAGVVVERFVNAGERVEDRPVLRVAMLDPLRVEVIVPASRWGSIKNRDQLRVQPDLPGVAPVLARVVHVDKLIDAASNTFRVRMDLPNPDGALPGGARCKVELPGMEGGSNPAAKPAAQPAVSPIMPARADLPSIPATPRASRKLAG